MPASPQVVTVVLPILIGRGQLGDDAVVSWRQVIGNRFTVDQPVRVRSLKALHAFAPQGA